MPGLFPRWRKDRSTAKPGSPDDALFTHLWKTGFTVPGWLSSGEARFLFDRARAHREAGQIVEVGSFCGRSSVIMAGALDGPDSPKLICVDTFAGSPEHQIGEAHFQIEFFRMGRIDTFDAFKGYLEAAGVSERVDARKSSSLDAAQAFSGSISLLFLDADHAYTSVCSDLDAWLPLVKAGGEVILHDFGTWEGPTRAAADLLKAGYKHNGTVDTAVSLTKPDDQTDDHAVPIQE